jgi:hypothetical protein
MPYSSRENDDFVFNFVHNNNIRWVLDIGPGAGKYYDILNPIVDGIDAVEVWEPYIERFDLKSKYGFIYNRDFAGMHPLDFGHYDLVIFGDVLEHMDREDSIYAWDLAKRIAKWGIISVPIIHYPQGESDGNPYEVHVQEHLTPEEIRETYGPFKHEALYDITGTFIKRF